MHKRKTIGRKDFLRISSLAAGGMLISFPLLLKAGGQKQQTAPAEGLLNAFLRIDSQNNICITLSKVEMGQGIFTTLPMLFAEELDCDWTKIKVEHIPTGKGDDFKQPVFTISTGGSDSTRSEFNRLRQAGATARQMLVNAAAKRFNTDPANCRTENGYVHFEYNQLSYGALAAEAAQGPVPVVSLREANKWKYIGRPQKRLDAAEKINGNAKYGLDIHFDGLLTAVVAHAPVFGGRVISFNAGKTLAVNGVRQVVPIPSGVAVIADNYWSAIQGREALIIEWDYGLHQNINSSEQLEAYKQLSKTKGVIVGAKGNVYNRLKEAGNSVEAVFSVPYLAHAPMEPLNCTVKIDGNGCQVWTATQAPLLRQAEIARYLGLVPEQVNFNTPVMGGSFGRRGTFSDDWVMEAVQIAQKSGKPIKLVWSREDDIKGGYYRPVYLHRVQIAIDNTGLPVAWLHRIVGQSLFINTPLEKEIVQNGIDYSSITTGKPYAASIDNYSFELHTTMAGVPVSSWRSVGNTHTAFVIETLIDELATTAGEDPVKYRQVLFQHFPRHLNTLNLAAEKSQWNQPLPAGVYRGIAIHDAMGSCVAQVVELSVVKKTIRVHRVVCAIDCGLAVNPEGVRAQMEGGIIFGLTAALYGEITLKNGKVQQSNFHNYPMLRMNESPVIEVHIVPSTADMGGAGEPGVPPVAPALANALFAATGIRQRSLPVKL